MRVRENELRVGHRHRQVRELARLVGVPRRVGIEKDGKPIFRGLRHDVGDGGVGHVELLCLRVQL